MTASRTRDARNPIYDHPLYYDILFGWDRSPEADFYCARLLESGIDPGARVLEVACGSGQIARRLAHRGWQCAGLDSRKAMLDFLQQESRAEGIFVEVLCAKMQSFETKTPFSAALNPMSSFRLLQADREAISHLNSMAAVLLSGGVYLLDLSFAGAEDEPATTTDESWTRSRGEISVRADDGGIFVEDGNDSLELGWGRETHLRPLTQTTFEGCIAQVPDLYIEAWYPESGRDDEGVSLFEQRIPASNTVAGRVMALVRRK